MELVINNFSGKRIDVRGIKGIADKISKKDFIVSISFVTQKKIHELNRVFRKKNKPTDVLSFNMDEGKLLGDVIICPQVAAKNAKEYGTSLKDEIMRLAAHGMLHLMGYDHSKKMFDLQDKVMGGN
jgi:probable rRNA maturation factor